MDLGVLGTLGRGRGCSHVAFKVGASGWGNKGAVSVAVEGLAAGKEKLSVQDKEYRD